MPKPYPREFRADIVRVAGGREPGRHLRQIAADFGIGESCLNELAEGPEDAGVVGRIRPSDPGSRFRSRKLVHAPSHHGPVGSMGRVGAAGDHAAMESFCAAPAVAYRSDTAIRLKATSHAGNFACCCLVRSPPCTS